MTNRKTHNSAMQLLNGLGVLNVSGSPADQIQLYKNELYEMYNTVTFLLRAQGEFAPLLQDPKVVGAPNSQTIARVVQGIVNDSNIIKQKLLVVQNQIKQIESVTIPDTYMVHAIGLHQELVNITQLYGDVVSPQLAHLSELISNVPGAGDTTTQGDTNVQQ